MITDPEQMSRVMRWFDGKLPLPPSLDTFHVRLSGPTTPQALALHTFACAYPDSGEYVVYGVENNFDPPLSAQQVRDKIAQCELPSGKAAEQEQILRGYDPGYDPEAGWQQALLASALAELPLVMYVYGVTAAGKVETSFLSVVLTAPVGRALAELKRAAAASGK